MNQNAYMVHWHLNDSREKCELDRSKRQLWFYLRSKIMCFHRAKAAKECLSTFENAPYVIRMSAEGAWFLREVLRAQIIKPSR